MVDEGGENTILWSGCLAEQTSADAYIEGNYNGAFSYNLVKQIRNSNNENKRSVTLKAVRESPECLTKFEDLPVGYSI